MRSPAFKIFIKITCAFTALVLLSTACFAQTVTGHVTDADTGLPLFNATIYLNGTYRVSVTDSTGRFKIEVADYRVPLIISYIGYESKQIENYMGTGLDVTLKRRANLLKEVTIAFDDGMSRKNKMRRFIDEFIGADNSECTIYNPDDIWLRYNKQNDELTAGADRPLIIFNKKLGYKITYFLTSFKSIPLHITYKGNYIFAEDTAGLSTGKLRRILKERLAVYIGSRMHFIRSLWADELGKNEFKIYRSKSSARGVSVYDLDQAEKLSSRDIVELRNDSVYAHQKFIVLSAEIAVVHEVRGKLVETSFVMPGEGYAGYYIFMNKDGNCGEGLEWKGNMGLARVSKLLPFEFTPIAQKR